MKKARLKPISSAKRRGFSEKVFPRHKFGVRAERHRQQCRRGQLCYSQSENGVLFPTNSAYVTVNAYDGTIDSFSMSWTDDVTFDSADGIVDADAAMAAYLGCYTAALQYVAIPVESETDYSYDYKLQLAYLPESEDDVTGVDAKTGKVIVQNNTDDAAAIAYDDLESCYGKPQIETLAKYGVGFPGASFHPTAQLTQKDALTLLLSAVGFSADDEDSLYQAAYRYNLLTVAERNPDNPLTRTSLVKMLIGASEYGPAARLTGIFSCGFADDGSISKENYGYVAIAKAWALCAAMKITALIPTASSPARMPPSSCTTSCQDSITDYFENYLQLITAVL
jgi:hypothetical protein